MVGAVISANPLQLDIRSHKKCMFICCIITVASFQYGLDYALVGGLCVPYRNLQKYNTTDNQQHGHAWFPTGVWLLR